LKERPWEKGGGRAVGRPDPPIAGKESAENTYPGGKKNGGTTKTQVPFAGGGKRDIGGGRRLLPGMGRKGAEKKAVNGTGPKGKAPKGCPNGGRGGIKSA